MSDYKYPWPEKRKPTMREGKIQEQIMAALNVIPGVRVWRNNVGVAITTHGAVRYGLAVGSADLIGMVDGRFLSIEVKTPKGRIRDDQKLWAETMTRLGALHCVARSPEDAVSYVTEARDGFRP